MMVIICISGFNMASKVEVTLSKLVTILVPNKGNVELYTLDIWISSVLLCIY